MNTEELMIRIKELSNQIFELQQEFPNITPNNEKLLKELQEELAKLELKKTM